MEYAIYCRKSTDDSSGKQEQSIPDQIDICVKHAHNNGLKIMEKPDNFAFEDELEIKKEDMDESPRNRRIYQDTRHLYIIKESKTGKTPGVRKKWRKLITLIKQGKIKGLLSYAPDRQARNIMEGGELINLVDEGLIDLKYTNFHFEPNAAGKMMLGIWFVFSKQYSDKLSEDTTRGTDNKILQGKAVGNYKHGYKFLPSGHHMPHPVYFDLWKQAFQMKIYDKKSDKYIGSWLKKRGYQREKFNDTGKVIKATQFKEKNMHTIRTDPFYYGIFIHGDNKVDLRDINEDYEPLIQEHEFDMLYQRFMDKSKQLTDKKVKEEHNELMPLWNKLITTEDGYNLSFTLPNKKRHRDKLIEMKEKNPDATIEDAVKPHQIYYRCTNKNSKFFNIRIKYDELLENICKLFDCVKINDKAYKEYTESIARKIRSDEQKLRTECAKIDMQIGKYRKQHKELVIQSIKIKGDEEADKIVQQERTRLEEIIETLKSEKNKLEVKDRNRTLEFEAFVKVLQEAGTRFRKLSYVQQRKITRLMFSNITIKGDLSVIIRGHEGLEDLFEGMGRSTGLEPAILGTTNRCFTG